MVSEVVPAADRMVDGGFVNGAVHQQYHPRSDTLIIAVGHTLYIRNRFVKIKRKFIWNFRFVFCFFHLT